jgi:hypothetical protein
MLWNDGCSLMRASLLAVFRIRIQDFDDYKLKQKIYSRTKLPSSIRHNIWILSRYEVPLKLGTNTLWSCSRMRTSGIFRRKENLYQLDNTIDHNLITKSDHRKHEKALFPTKYVTGHNLMQRSKICSTLTDGQTIFFLRRVVQLWLVMNELKPVRKGKEGVGRQRRYLITYFHIFYDSLRLTSLLKKWLTKCIAKICTETT